MTDLTGTIYLVHFAQPYKHARHYLGWASQLKRRIAHHRNGTGARFMRVVTEAGIDWKIVRTWTGTRHDERRLKNRHNSAKLCPVCRQNAQACKGKHDH